MSDHYTTAVTVPEHQIPTLIDDVLEHVYGEDVEVTAWQPHRVTFPDCGCRVDRRGNLLVRCDYHAGDEEPWLDRREDDR